MNKLPELLTDRLVFKNFDCNRGYTDKLGDEMYYRFFNEWKDLTHVKVKGKIYKVCKYSYDGVVSLVLVD